MTPRLRPVLHLSGPLLALALCSGGAQAGVFVNELHYDNSGGDNGERIEVVATAGETLTGYRIYLYNGATAGAATYYDTDPLPSGDVRSCGGAVRVATVGYPANGIQNGGPDALALVDPGGAVVQFLSYEGTVKGANGPAAGRWSQPLPVSESDATAVGTSLQLGGAGSEPGDFSWRRSQAGTFGACNRDQLFTSPDPAPAVVATEPADGAIDFPAAADLGVTFSEPVALAPGALSLQCSQSGAVSLGYASSGTRFVVSTGTALRGGESCQMRVRAGLVADSRGAPALQDTTVDFSVAAPGGGGGDYYGRVNTSTAGQLRCSLHQTIRGHSVYPYSGSGTSTWSILEIADEDPRDPGRVLDAYRNRSYAKGGDRAGTGTGVTYNREHTWPNSLGFGSSSGDLGLPHAPYTDTHMLYLTDTRYNADRGNKPYAPCTALANCGERPTDANGGNGGGSGVFPGNSNWVDSSGFQVWGARRGDMARAVMYMAIRYEGGRDINTRQSEPDLELTDDRSRIRATATSPAYMGLLSTLLAWHQADPPDAAERERNEVIFSFQGNRNPFIDRPDWATRALFTSTRPVTCLLN